MKFLELNQIMNKNPAKIFEAIKKSDVAKNVTQNPILEDSKFTISLVIDLT